MRKDFKFGLIAGTAFSVIFLVGYLYNKNNSPEQNNSARAVSRSEDGGDDVSTQSSVVPLRTQEGGYLPEGQIDLIKKLERQARRSTSPQVVPDVPDEQDVQEVEASQVDELVQEEIRTYTVVSGDTLSGISKRFYGTTTQWQKILDANRKTLKSPAGLKPGMELTIPE